jgi:hypothetical protein
MLSSNKINIVTTQLFQIQKMPVQIFYGNRLSNLSPGQSLILAKNTGQATVGKENGSAALVSGKAGLLPEMGSCSSDMHSTSCMAKSTLSLQAIDPALPWTKSTGSIG